MAHKPNDLKSLKKKWYKKLKDKGFIDIEYNEEKLRWYSTEFTKAKTIANWEAKEAYYRMARYFLNDYYFSTNLEKVIWEYHTNGLSIRDITDTLRKARVWKKSRRGIHEILQRLETEMKTRYLVGFDEQF